MPGFDDWTQPPDFEVRAQQFSAAILAQAEILQQTSLHVLRVWTEDYLSETKEAWAYFKLYEWSDRIDIQTSSECVIEIFAESEDKAVMLAFAKFVYDQAEHFDGNIDEYHSLTMDLENDGVNLVDETFGIYGFYLFYQFR